MAVAPSRTPLDAERLRADFPIFDRPVHGDKRLVYLDSASSTQKPRQVIDRLVEVYETSYANVHRGVYSLGEAATAAYEAARDTVAGLLRAPDRREVIFVRDTTEGLNLVAYAYGRKFVGPATRSSRPRWSTTRTWCRGSSSRSRPAPRCTTCG